MSNKVILVNTLAYNNRVKKFLPFEDLTQELQQISDSVEEDIVVSFFKTDSEEQQPITHVVVVTTKSNPL